MSQEDDDFKKRNALWGEYSDAYLDRGDKDDPEYWSEDRVANRDRWRKGSNLLQDNVAKEITQDASDTGADSDTALARLGFRDQKDHGKYITGLFGNNGLYAREGAAVDPNLDYNWSTGRATWKAGLDNAGQSRAINANERNEYNKARQYRDAGLQGYGQQQQATNFQKIRNTHFGRDDKGIWSNQANNGEWELRDDYGRRVAAPAGSRYVNNIQGQQQPGTQNYSMPNFWQKPMQTSYQGYGMFPGYGQQQDQPQQQSFSTPPQQARAQRTGINAHGGPRVSGNQNQVSLFNRQRQYQDDPLDPQAQGMSQNRGY